MTGVYASARCYSAGVGSHSRKPAQGPDAPPALGGTLRVLPCNGNDEELLQRIKRQDQVAAALLYDQYADDVNRLVWRLLGAWPVE